MVRPPALPNARTLRLQSCRVSVAHGDIVCRRVFDRSTLAKVMEKELPGSDPRSDKHGEKPDTDMRRGGSAGNGRTVRYTWDKTELIIAAGSHAMFLDSTDYEVKRQFEVPTEKGYEAGIQACDQHPDGSIFVTGGNDHIVRMHDGKTGEILETQRSHHGPVHAVAFHPHGTSYATGAGDSAVRIWRFNPAGSVPEAEAAAN